MAGSGFVKRDMFCMLCLGGSCFVDGLDVSRKRRVEGRQDAGDSRPCCDSTVLDCRVQFAELNKNYFLYFLELFFHLIQYPACKCCIHRLTPVTVEGSWHVTSAGQSEAVAQPHCLMQPMAAIPGRSLTTRGWRLTGACTLLF